MFSLTRSLIVPSNPRDAASSTTMALASYYREGGREGGGRGRDGENVLRGDIPRKYVRFFEEVSSVII